MAFRHELARLAIEASLPPDRAVALHRHAIAALAHPATGAPDLARLAHHAEAAADTPAVLRYAPAAAEHAAAVGAPREAQNQYARALRFARGLAPELRADLLERFGGVGYLTDMREEAVQALAEALAIHRARGDLLRQGEVLRLRSRLLTCMGRTTEARTAAVEAIELLEQCEPGPELARAYSALSHASMLADDVEGTMLWGRRAIALADRVGDTEALVNALNNVGSCELSHGREAGRDKLERSLALARQAGLGPDVGRAYINLVAVFGRRHQWSEAERYLDRRHRVLPGARSRGVVEMPDRREGPCAAGTRRLGCRRRVGDVPAGRTAGRRGGPSPRRAAGPRARPSAPRRPPVLGAARRGTGDRGVGGRPAVPGARGRGPRRGGMAGGPTGRGPRRDPGGVRPRPEARRALVPGQLACWRARAGAPPETTSPSRTRTRPR